MKPRRRTRSVRAFASTPSTWSSRRASASRPSLTWMCTRRPLPPHWRRRAAPRHKKTLAVRFDRKTCAVSSPVLSTIGILARFRLFVAPSGGGSFRVGYDVDPLRVRRGFSVVVIVPVPPLVRRGLRVTLWRVLPGFLTAERRDVEIAPDGSHGLVAAVVDEVCAEHPFAVAEEHVVAVPFIHAEVRVEVIGNGVPGHLPSHTLFQASDVRLGCA